MAFTYCFPFDITSGAVFHLCSLHAWTSSILSAGDYLTIAPECRNALPDFAATPTNYFIYFSRLVELCGLLFCQGFTKFLCPLKLPFRYLETSAPRSLTTPYLGGCHGFRRRFMLVKMSVIWLFEILHCHHTSSISGMRSHQWHLCIMLSFSAGPTLFILSLSLLVPISFRGYENRIHLFAYSSPSLPSIWSFCTHFGDLFLLLYLHWRDSCIFYTRSEFTNTFFVYSHLWSVQFAACVLLSTYIASC